MTTRRFSGLLCPVVTPFCDDLAPDGELLAAQCRWLLSQHSGLAVFGTNSEANSLSVDEKLDLLDTLVDCGIDPERLMPGTGCCALTDTVRLTRRAVELGCGGVLMLPPFYYKHVSDEGLWRSFAEIIDRVGDARLQIYLYHIPPVSQVPLTLPLIERLVREFPDTIAGIKDSSGDWANTAALLERQWDDFRVFCGSEAFLLPTMRAGGAGCISATANINPAAIHDLYANWQADDAKERQHALNDLRDLVQVLPMIPALKSVVAHFSGVTRWRNVRPPLVALTDAQRDGLITSLAGEGFDMPGLPGGG
ncbi:MAG: dihydrodipicolinate synthase family protein [Woeseiaceae bacterium]|nr:dihydrodipicolinate synthase family protein [Woeseiaceae bacterium]